MKFGIRSAVDVVFKTTRSYTGSEEDYLLAPGTPWAKGEPVLYFDSLKTATTEGTSNTVYAQGGDGNPRLIAWEGEKVVTFTFEDALISPEGMSILTGAGLIEASETNLVRVHKKAVLRGIVSGGVLTLADIEDLDIPANSYVLRDQLLGIGEELVTEDIFAFVVDGSGEIKERLGAATGVPLVTDIKFATDSIEEEEVSVLIDYYVSRSSGVQEIIISPNEFAGYFYIEGDTLFRRQSDGRDLAAQMIIPNAKIQTAFNFSMSPSGDPSTFTFTADALPGTLKGDTSGKQKMYALQIMND